MYEITTKTKSHEAKFLNSWTQKTDFPGGKRVDIDGAHFAIGNYGFVGTGSGSSLYNDFWKYNAATDTWTPIPNLPAIGRIGASNFSINNKGYICLGFWLAAVPNYLNDLWEYTDTTNVGVEENNFNTFFSLYPNPTNGKVQIQSTKYKVENIKVFNAVGEKVEAPTLKGANNSTIDLTTKTSGVYFIHIICKEGTAVKKITINK